MGCVYSQDQGFIGEPFAGCLHGRASVHAPVLAHKRDFQAEDCLLDRVDLALAPKFRHERCECGAELLIPLRSKACQRHENLCELHVVERPPHPLGCTVWLSCADCGLVTATTSSLTLVKWYACAAVARHVHHAGGWAPASLHFFTEQSDLKALALSPYDARYTDILLPGLDKDLQPAYNGIPIARLASQQELLSYVRRASSRQRTALQYSTSQTLGHQAGASLSPSTAPPLQG